MAEQLLDGDAVALLEQARRQLLDGVVQASLCSSTSCITTAATIDLVRLAIANRCRALSTSRGLRRARPLTRVVVPRLSPTTVTMPGKEPVSVKMSISCWTFFSRAPLPASALLLRPDSEELPAVQEAVLEWRP